MSDYEIFLINKDKNELLSLDKDDIFFFNTANFDEEDFAQLKDNNLSYLVDKGLALKFDTQMIYRMYLGFVNRNLCYECKQRVGNQDGKGFGSLPA